MFKTIIITLAVLSASTAAIGEPFYVGIWKNEYTRCSTSGGEGQPLRITETEFFGLENRCDLVNPKYLSDNDGIDGVLFQRKCMGEGMEYTDSILFLKEYDNQLTTHSDGFTNTYSRCE